MEMEGKSEDGRIGRVIKNNERVEVCGSVAFVS